jgi:hypothetical protein
MRRLMSKRSFLLGAVAATALATAGGGSADAAKTVNGMVWPWFHDRAGNPGQEGHEAEGRDAVPLCDPGPRGHSRLPSDRARSQPSAHERAIHRDEEFRAETEEGELPLRLRPALRDHARPLPGLLSRD